MSSAPSSRSVLAALWPAAPPPTITYSGTCELRLALLRERAKSLARVRRLEQLRDPGALARQPLGERLVDALVRGELDLADRGRRAGRQRVRVRARALGGLVRREQAVEDAEPVCLARRDLTPGDHQVERAGRADQAREPLRAAVAGQQAERHLRDAELVAPARAEAQVAGERDLQPAAERVPLDLGDEHLRNGGDAGE